MAITQGTEPTLGAARYWAEHCLIADGSLFSQDKLWTPDHVAELDRFFVENLDMGEGNFLSKLRDQIAPTSQGAKKLAAEMLWVMSLFPANVGQEAKVRLVREVWSWSGSTLSDENAFLKEPLAQGIGSVGQSYLTRRWAELIFLIRFVGRFKRESGGTRRELLQDPWRFANYLDQTEDANKRQLRHTLLHLLFPLSFERIGSRGHREAIDSFYASLVPKTMRDGLPGDSPTVALDRRLGEIRNALTSRYPDAVFDFYNAPVQAQWRKKKTLSQESDLTSGVYDLRARLERILAEYLPARTGEPFSGTHSIMDAFRFAQAALANTKAVKKRPHLMVKWSGGQGNWARIPWIALLDRRETSSTQRGVYCVFLFRQDMSGVYLTFNQGVTQPNDQLGKGRARALLRERAQKLRIASPNLAKSGFILDDRIDLRVEGGLGGEYEGSTIAYRIYEAGQVPNTESIDADLEAVLSAYDSYLANSDAKPTAQSQKSWIFQANPSFFDLRGAMRKLTEIRWLVKQHGDEVAAGDRVFLWEAGRDGGIVATAEVMSSPEIVAIAKSEEQFVLEAAKFNGQQLRVPLRIEQILRTPLTRGQLLEVPGLRDLSILRAPQGTNFAVTDEEVEILLAMIAQPQLPERAAPVLDLEAIQTSFSSGLSASNISFGSRHNDITRAFIASLATKPFVILTGLSGSGKSQLAIRFGDWCGKGRFLIVPVRPDWTGAEALFGYEDALLPTIDGKRAWHVPEALEFMLKAASDPSRPYVLILDEMNLAHVERYFADVLSGMESGEVCLPNLRREEGSWYPLGLNKIRVPDNLFIIGTVNVDETTYTFSPKVLDRANTLEFRVATDELDHTAKKPVACEEGPEDLVRGFLAVARDTEFHLAHPNPKLDEFRKSLLGLHSVLTDGGFEFGHRVFVEATRFASMYAECGGQRWEDALDFQVLQKVLPRLHGSRRRLEPTLSALSKFCVDLAPLSESGLEDSAKGFDPLAPLVKVPVLPRSFEKLKRMTRSIRANQFASFTE